MNLIETFTRIWICWEVCQAVDLTNVLHKELMGLTNKTWFLYVRRMACSPIYSLLKNMVATEPLENIISIIMLSKKQSQIYLSKSRSVEDVTPGVEMTGFTCDQKSQPFYKFSGMLPLQRQILAGKGRHPHVAFYYITFNAQKDLALNLTFPVIYFTTILCTLGMLRVCELDLVFYTCKTVVMAQHYSRSHKLKVGFHIRAGVIYQIHLMYMVMDRQLLYTWHPATSHRRINGQIESLPMRFIIKNGNTLAFMHISGEKFHQITLFVFHSPDDILSVYEGPGILGNSLTAQRHNFRVLVYETATFQATVICRFKFKYFQPIHKGCRVRFKGIKVKHNKMSALSEGHTFLFRYSTKLASPRSFILVLATQLNAFVEVVISNLTFIGIQNNISECREAGFVWFNITRYKFSEIKTVCRTQNAEHHYRKIHSATNELLLVFYAFDGYLREFTIHITASASNCFPVSIDPCKHDTSYSVAIFTETETKITIEKFHERKAKHLTVPLNEHKCLVVQIDNPDGRHKHQYHFQTRCFVRVKPGVFTEQNYFLHYQVDGFLQGYTPPQIEHGRLLLLCQFRHIWHSLTTYIFSLGLALFLRQTWEVCSHLNFIMDGLVSVQFVFLGVLFLLDLKHEVCASFWFCGFWRSCLSLHGNF